MTFSLTQDDHGTFDLSFDGSALETEIIISLFTDARVTDDELPEGDNDKRGWWGEPIGSKLWLLKRALATKETLDRAESYSAEALQRLVEIGLAREINTKARWLNAGVMLLEIEVVKPDGDTLSIRFKDMWSDQVNVVQ